jgi:hypothetical protein
MYLYQRRLMNCFAILLLTFNCASAHGGATAKNGSGESKLSQSDIDFGQLQVENMVRDRPKMAAIIGKHSPVWNWVVRQFAGEVTGRRYLWRNHPELKDPHKHLASHFHSPDETGWITVQEIDEDGYAVGGEQAWAMAIYELLNTRNDPSFEELTAKAIQGKLSKDDYSRKSAELEFASSKELSLFYRNVWVAQVGATPTDQRQKYWYVDFPESYDEWKRGWDPNRSSPEDPYHYRYDTEIRAQQKK